MNHHTLQNQQARSKNWAYYRTPELLAFYPQGTCQDLTNFNIQTDPAWEVSPCGPIPGERHGFKEKHFHKPVIKHQPSSLLEQLGQQISNRNLIREELVRIEERIQIFGYKKDYRTRKRITKNLIQVESLIEKIKDRINK